MITVIIAGGSGTRLWPLSTPDYPKHLLKLVGDESVLQTTYNRAKMIADKVYILTEASHSDHVKQQIPELIDDNFIIEPGRRGTANCIVMALDVISRRHDADEPVAFIHSDHQIRDNEGFKKSFESAFEVSVKNHEITLIGIEPTYAATGFGYLERGEVIDSENNINKVVSFKEKPDEATAKNYIDTGRYLWNCGYFVGTVQIFLDEMNRSAAELKSTYDKLHSIDDFKSSEYRDAYLSLESSVIDTELIEKAKSLAVVGASFDWMDIGSFKDLHEANDSDTSGNHFRGEMIYDEGLRNVYIRNEEDKPVVVIGLEDVVVVNTPEGILVTHKDKTLKLKDAVTKIQEDRSNK